MAVFAYRATNTQGAMVQGTIAADTPRQARDLLRGRGLSVRLVNRHRTRRGRRSPSLNWKKGSSSKLASTVRELGTLLAVGIPLTEALDTLIRQHSGRFQASLMLVRDRVASGSGLAAALGEQPDVFDALSVRMVEVGEKAGTLDVVLDQLAEFKERALELKDRVLSALLYPLIVLAVSCGVCLFLMSVVVPMLLTNLLEAGRELPWPTRVLKLFSDALVYHGWWLAMVSAMGIIGFVALLRTARGRWHWHRLILKIPIIGPMTLKQTMSRVALVMSTLIRSGVVYLNALEIAAKSTRNVVLRDALEKSGEAVGAGRDIGQALENSGLFPPLAVHIFSVGQQSGRLEDMLDRLAITYDRQVTTASTRLAAVLEPILILVLAVFVGFILFATMLPILEAGNVL